MTSKRIGLFIACVFFVVLSTHFIGCVSTTTKARATAEEQFSEAMKDFQRKHYLQAIDGFKKVIYNFSGASMVDSAQYFLGMSQYQQEDYFTAAAEFERLVNSYPGSSFVDDGQYMMGICLFKASSRHYGLDQEDLQKAITALEDFVTDYSYSEYVNDARVTIKLARDRLARKRFENGYSYFRLGYYDAADVYFQTVIDEYTEAEWAANALYYQGEIVYKKHDLPKAKEKFNNFLIVYPDHKLADKARKMIEKIDKKLETVTGKK